MPRREGARAAASTARARTARGGRRLKVLPIEAVEYNPAMPKPTLREITVQLCLLWPVEYTIARWLGLPQGGGWTPLEETVVGALTAMIWEGCTRWKQEAHLLHEVVEARLPEVRLTTGFLRGPEGGMVFWLWTVGEHMRGEEVAAVLTKYLPWYHPYVLRPELSIATALTAYERVESICRHRGLRSLQRATHGA